MKLLFKFSEAIGISVGDLRSGSRVPKLATARALYWKLRKEKDDWTYQRIANETKRSSHGTIITGINKVNGQLEKGDKETWTLWAKVSHLQEKVITVRPLFITEEGIKIYSNDATVTGVTEDFKIRVAKYRAFSNPSRYKFYKHKQNAEEYIWKHKKLFSYNDILLWYINEGEDFTNLEEKAKKLNK